jgi:hypothetical protein
MTNPSHTSLCLTAFFFLFFLHAGEGKSEQDAIAQRKIEGYEQEKRRAQGWLLGIKCLRGFAFISHSAQCKTRPLVACQMPKSACQAAAAMSLATRDRHRELHIAQIIIMLHLAIDNKPQHTAHPHTHMHMPMCICICTNPPATEPAFSVMCLYGGLKLGGWGLAENAPSPFFFFFVFFSAHHYTQCAQLTAATA